VRIFFVRQGEKRRRCSASASIFNAVWRKIDQPKLISYSFIIPLQTGAKQNNTMKKIICAHLYNDYSGSPLVLSTVVKNLVKEGRSVDLITSGNTKGFLTGLDGVTYHPFTYTFQSNKFLRLLQLLRSQVIMFLRVLTYFRTDAVVYVNTLLPFGAALAGRLTGKKVVYHMHETTVNPPILKGFLKAMASICASEAVYVSHFLEEKEPLWGVPSRVVYNCLSKDFVEKAEAHLSGHAQDKPSPFTILMLCSLKIYKGVNEYVKLAASLPEYRFVLVLNSSELAIKEFFKGQPLPDNLIVFPSQKEVHTFYQEAHLVLNLSHPEQWVETFGMTLLEAMSYGLPVIAPPVGGPDELVKNGYNGFKIDQRHFATLKQKIRETCKDPVTYSSLSANAVEFAKRFNEKHFGREIGEVVAG